MATAAFAAALMLFHAGGAEAQQWRSVVTAQLDAAAGFLAESGHGRANVLQPNQQIGVLADGSTAYVEVMLQSGVEYVISGGCDQDCSDLDLRLFRAEGFEPVVSDVEVDDVPVLVFTATTSGAYLLGIDMAECTSSICYYGVRMFQK